jgi:hypothetical protein
MAGTQEELARNIVKFLKAELVDPLTRGSDWIFVKFPQVEVESPTISVFDRGVSRRKEIGIGNEGSYFWKRMDIMIHTDRITVVTIDSTKYSGPTIVDHFIDKLLDAFNDNFDTLSTTYGIKDRIIMDFNSLPYDGTAQVYSGIVSVVLLVDKTVS